MPLLSLDERVPKAPDPYPVRSLIAHKLVLAPLQNRALTLKLYMWNRYIVSNKVARINLALIPIKEHVTNELLHTEYKLFNDYK